MSEDGDDTASSQPTIRDTERALLEPYHTHPRLLAGAPRLRVHDCIHRQIQAFEKLIAHAKDKFDRDKTTTMLSVASGSSVFIRGVKVVTKKTAFRNPIGSLEELRTFSVNIENKLRREGHDRVNIVAFETFMSNFFADLQFMKEMKHFFDERIYSAMYEYFYDPTDAAVALATLESVEKARVPPPKAPPIGRPNAPRPDPKAQTMNFKTSLSSKPNPTAPFPKNQSDKVVLPPGKGMSDKAMLDLPVAVKDEHIAGDQKKLAQTVNELYSISEKWDALFTDKTIDIKLFEPLSKQFVVQYNDTAHFEGVLRLIPDMTLKAEKCIKLIRDWWTFANKLYGGNTIPALHFLKLDPSAQMFEIQDKIARINSELKIERELMKVQEVELEKLIARERFLDSQQQMYTDTEKKKNACAHKFNTLLASRDELMTAVQNEKTEEKRSLAAERLRGIEAELRDLHSNFKILDYQFELSQDDYHLGIEIKPDLIRLTDDVKSKIIALKTTIGKKVLEVDQLEKELIFLQSNTSKKRDVMGRRNDDFKAKAPSRLPRMTPRPNDPKNLTSRSNRTGLYASASDSGANSVYDTEETSSI